jgi:hypothetical protein
VPTHLYARTQSLPCSLLLPTLHRADAQERLPQATPRAHCPPLPVYTRPHPADPPKSNSADLPYTRPREATRDRARQYVSTTAAAPVTNSSDPTRAEARRKV